MINNGKYVIKIANDSIYSQKIGFKKHAINAFYVASLIFLTSTMLVYANTPSDYFVECLKTIQVFFINVPLSIYLINKLFNNRSR
jgi:hypothetical protein